MKIKTTNSSSLLFFCPGCKSVHAVNHLWKYNGDADMPTFSPSILVRGTIPITDLEAEQILLGEKIKPVPFVCHSFITDGKIQFLNDCTHELVGQTVEMVEWDRQYE